MVKTISQKYNKTYFKNIENRKAEKFFKLLISFFVIMMVSVSCVPHHKMVYLQREAEAADTLMFKKPEYLIKPGDILHIKVLTLDEESYIIFNNAESRQLGGGGGGSSNNVSVFLSGYTVDDQGKVQMPVLGDVSVAGKSIKGATQSIEILLEEYILDATVMIKLVNFSVSVLGEVRRPGNYYIYDNQITVMDAISMAGDLTDFGNRKVNIVRQTQEGASFAVLDITKAEALTSEFYYLQPNDIIYIEPHRVKRLGFSQFPFALVFSSISTTLLLINFFSN